MMPPSIAPLAAPIPPPTAAPTAANKAMYATADHSLSLRRRMDGTASATNTKIHITAASGTTQNHMSKNFGSVTAAAPKPSRTTTLLAQMTTVAGDMQTNVRVVAR